MRKISFTSVSIALLIVCFYTFVFCMVKNVDGTAPAMETMVDSAETDYSSANETECLGKADASQSAETTAEVFEKYIETSWWKANLEAYTNT